MGNFSKLFTALSFLKVRSPDLFWFQWGYPLFLCLLELLGYWLLPDKPSFFGDKGLIESANGLMSMLIGFYIAALAAIASFPSANLDKYMDGRSVRICIKRGGDNKIESLTRRRFLCIIFGYCAFVSIFIYVIGASSRFVLGLISYFSIIIKWTYLFKFAWTVLYFFFSSSLLIVTLLGMHYLIDRMHRE